MEETFLRALRSLLYIAFKYTVDEMLVEEILLRESVKEFFLLGNNNGISRHCCCE